MKIDFEVIEKALVRHIVEADVDSFSSLIGTAEKTARGFSGFIARVCVERRMMKSEFA